VISEPQLDEVAEVLARPRIRSRYAIAVEDIAELLVLLRERGDLVEVTGRVRLCRDPDDDLLIESALNGRAEVLVTRDDDLKAEPALIAVLQAQGVTILTVRQFLAALEGEIRSGT
jgi:putative PIN family toxin of toxin-antitoxin system